MAELLLELLSEEIPARMQARAAADLKRLVTDGLAKADLAFDSARSFATPRRLTLVVDGLPLAQPDVTEEKRGPRVDAPEKAVQGFLGSIGLTIDQVEQREAPKGTFLFAVVERKGRAAADVVKETVEGALAALPWPKSMRWEETGVRWVRPLKSILCLLDGAVVPVRHGPLTAADATAGHRFLAPGSLAVKDFADYQAKLGKARIVLDGDERAAMIRDGATALAENAGLTVKPDEGLLAEVAGLVEWPVVLMGTIDEAFMGVPPEVLTTAMRAHQKYFSLLDGDGSLAPRFIVVANTEAADGGAAIVAGNERVLRARLSDATFFWDQDRKASLESRVSALGGRIFYKGLGTVEDKAHRLAGLAEGLAASVPGCDAAKAKRAALLGKADLSTAMVGEFPELQGVMGRYYAVNDGEDEAVARAVAEHYSPLGPNDACPDAPVSVAVALADKIDSLVGFFAIDEKPTGSKDPFALRRAALGVIRLIIENGLRLPLAQAFTSAYGLYRDHPGVQFAPPPERIVDDLLEFFADRLKVHLRDQGVRHDLITAVFALGGEDDLVRLLDRVRALEGFLGTEDGANLLTAFKRATNIVRIEEKKDGVGYEGSVDEGRLTEPQEQTLFASLAKAGDGITAALADERYAEAMTHLARLRVPVDGFFDTVTVNCEEPDLRGNRLRLLSQIRSALGGVADFSRIEG